MITPSFSLTATERVLPKLALDFTTASLDPRVTFTRTTGASNPATYVNNSGVITAATNNQPRFDYDPITLVCKGLLIEESRANLLNYSASVGSTGWSTSNAGTASLPTVTANFATAPDGTTTASRLQMTLNGGTGSTANFCTVQHNVVSLTNGASYAQSIYLKSNDSNTYVMLLRDDSGSGAFSKLLTITPQWQRFDQSVVASATAGSGIRLWLRGGLGTSDTVDVLAWGGQLEAGAFATSYIPTTTTALTRNADVATMTGTNFSSWFNASEGTFVTQVEQNGLTGLRGIMGLGAGAGADNHYLTYAGSDAAYSISTGGVTQASITVAKNTTCCFTYKTNTARLAAGGGSPGSDSSVTLPTVTTLQIGNFWNNPSYYLNGWVEQIMYYPQVFTASETQAFSK